MDVSLMETKWEIKVRTAGMSAKVLKQLPRASEFDEVAALEPLVWFQSTILDKDLWGPALLGKLDGQLVVLTRAQDCGYGKRKGIRFFWKDEEVPFAAVT